MSFPYSPLHANQGLVRACLLTAGLLIACQGRGMSACSHQCSLAALRCGFLLHTFSLHSGLQFRVILVVLVTGTMAGGSPRPLVRPCSVQQRGLLQQHEHSGSPATRRLLLDHLASMIPYMQTCESTCYFNGRTSRRLTPHHSSSATISASRP